MAVARAAAVAVAEALVQALVAARGLAWIPPGTPLVRCVHAWSFRFARLPSSFVLVLALWWELEVAAGAKAKMGAQGCRAQEPQAAQAFEQKENVIDPSAVWDEQFRQQAVRQLSSNSNHLWQSHQPLAEVEVAGYY